MDDQEYLYLKRKILQTTNINLDSYKSQQMRRRLNAFLARSPANNLVEYGRMLEQNRDTLNELRDFLTINVSEFFRDSSPFKQLSTVIIPQLLKHTPRLNILSAGCSHGAEPYTIAIILDEISPYHHHRILGTDIDESTLKRAKAGGPYSPIEVKNVPQGWLQKYFTRSNGDYTIIDKIRRRVEFKQQNLLEGEFEKGFDLVICRNVTIYFTEKAKKELNQRFYHSLKEEGVLFIGGTETMLDIAHIGFKSLGATFYQKPAAALVEV